MLSIKEHLTILYVTMADFFDAHPTLAQWRESNHSQPAFTDAEVLTIALMQSYFRTDTLKRTFLLVRANDPRLSLIVAPTNSGCNGSTACRRKWERAGAVLGSQPLRPSFTC